MKYLYGLFERSRRPGELSSHLRGGKSILERRLELERLRDATGSAHIDIKSCALVVFLMKYLYGLFERSGRPGELSGHPRGAKSIFRRRLELHRLREATVSANIDIKICVLVVFLIKLSIRSV